MKCCCYQVRSMGHIYREGSKRNRWKSVVGTLCHWVFGSALPLMSVEFTGCLCEWQLQWWSRLTGLSVVELGSKRAHVHGCLEFYISLLAGLGPTSVYIVYGNLIGLGPACIYLYCEAEWSRTWLYIVVVRIGLGPDCIYHCRVSWSGTWFYVLILWITWADEELSMYSENGANATVAKNSGELTYILSY